jgi:predicted unusual protein kinase regulating ubiquinone biosynthesis (AarF/ABC1/UbiB family)
MDFWSLLQQVNILKFLSPLQRQEATRSAEKSDHKSLTLPERLRHAFEELGPAFVKLDKSRRA